MKYNIKVWTKNNDKLYFTFSKKELDELKENKDEQTK